MKKSSVFNATVILMIFFPILNLKEYGETHVSIIFFILSAIYIKFNFRKINNIEFIPIALFSILQILILISWFQDISNGNTEFADFFSALRPTFLLTTYFGFLLYFQKSNAEITLENIFFNTSILLLAMFLSTFAFESLIPIKDLIYFPSERFRDKAFTSVFASTYFAAYFYFIIFSYSFCKLISAKNKYKFAFMSASSMIFIALSQGKSAYLSAIITIIIVAWIYSDLRIKLFFVSPIIVFLTYNCYYYWDSIAMSLSEADYFSLTQLSLYMSQGIEFGSADHRMNQMQFAIESSLNNNLLGLGLGKGIYLESFISSYTYRYGIIGFFMYVLFYLYGIKRSFKLSKESPSQEKKTTYIFLGVWLINIPILMLSSPMFEMGKNSIISIMLISILFSFKRNKQKIPQN